MFLTFFGNASDESPVSAALSLTVCLARQFALCGELNGGYS
jgi:hypothetical protein